MCSWIRSSAACSRPAPSILFTNTRLSGKKNRYSNLETTGILIKKEKKIFLIYKEIQTGLDAKSYMRKSLLIYEEMRKY